MAGAGRQVLVDLLAEGIRTGELPADTDPGLGEALAGAIVLRRLMSPQPLDPVDVPASWPSGRRPSIAVADRASLAAHQSSLRFAAAPRWKPYRRGSNRGGTRAEAELAVPRV